MACPSPSQALLGDRAAAEECWLHSQVTESHCCLLECTKSTPWDVFSRSFYSVEEFTSIEDYMVALLCSAISMHGILQSTRPCSKELTSNHLLGRGGGVNREESTSILVAGA